MENEWYRECQGCDCENEIDDFTAIQICQKCAGKLESIGVLRDLYDLCVKADAAGDLPFHINADILDRAMEVLK